MVFDTVHKIGAGVIGLLVAVMFLGRAYYVHEINRLETQITVMRIEAQEAEISALQKQRETEHEWQAKADAAAEAAAQDLADVEANYKRSIDELYAVLAAHGDVQLLDDGSGGYTTALPGAAGTAAGVAKSTADQCRAACRGNLKRLSEDIMTLARDCDINDKYLRRWAEFYDGLRKQK